jgi:hypothetical protein
MLPTSAGLLEDMTTFVLAGLDALAASPAGGPAGAP